MKICKNIECGVSIPDRLTYCCLSCRNIYVNKYIRDYTILKTRKSKQRIKYEKQPKQCLYCARSIPYLKRKNKYCNHSCRASATNKSRKIDKQATYRKVGTTLRQQAKDIYNLNPKKCVLCAQSIFYERRRRRYCSNACRLSKRDHSKNLSLYRYRAKFTFNIYDFPTEFDFSLIDRYGWYSPSNRNNNLIGVSRDHRYSIKEGFQNNVDPKILSHPANCCLLLHSENVSKYSSSSISLETLYERIQKWDQKYANLITVE